MRPGKRPVRKIDVGYDLPGAEDYIARSNESTVVGDRKRYPHLCAGKMLYVNTNEALPTLSVVYAS